MAVHSFHLFPVFARTERVSVDLKIDIPPSGEHGYFWALQVDWADGTGAHIGLQWWPGYPLSRAANWGGYGPDGNELAGSEAMWPSALDNPNTRDYPWEPGEWYRLEVDATGWGFIGGEAFRQLDIGSAEIVRTAVWTEIFAPCDAPMTQVRWRGPALGETGKVRTNYEPTCRNSASWREGDELVQAGGLPKRSFRRGARRSTFV